LDFLGHGNYMLCLIHRFGSVPTLVTLLEQHSNLESLRLAETLAQRFWKTALDSLPCFLYHHNHHHHRATTIGEFVDHLIVPSSPRVPPPETLTEGVHPADIHTTPALINHHPCWLSTTHHAIRTYQQLPSTQHYLALLDILQQLQFISLELLHAVPDGRLPFLEQRVGLPALLARLDRLLTTLTTQTYDSSWHYLVDLLTQRVMALQARIQAVPTTTTPQAAAATFHQQQWHTVYATVSAHVADLHQKVCAFSPVDGDWHDLARQVHAARHGNTHTTLMQLYHRLLDSTHTHADYKALTQQWHDLDGAMDTARHSLHQHKRHQAFLRHCVQIEADAMDLEHQLLECRQEDDDRWMKMWVADLDETITRALQWAGPGTDGVCVALTRRQAAYHQAWKVYRSYRRCLQRALALDALRDRVTGCLTNLLQDGGDLKAWKQHYSQLRTDADAWLLQYGQGVDTVPLVEGLARIQHQLATLEARQHRASAWRTTLAWAHAVAVSISDVVHLDREPNQQAMDNYTHSLAQLLVDDTQQYLDQQAGELIPLFHASCLVFTQRKHTMTSLAHLNELHASSQLLSGRLTAALQATTAAVENGTLHDPVFDLWHDSVILAWRDSQPQLSPTPLAVNDLVRWKVLMAFDAILAHHVCCLVQAWQARLLWETQWHKDMDDPHTDDDGTVHHLFATLQHHYPMKIPLHLCERQRTLEQRIANQIKRRRLDCMNSAMQVELACDRMRVLLDQDVLDEQQWAELQQQQRHLLSASPDQQLALDSLQQRSLARHVFLLQQQFIQAYHHSASVVETRLQQGDIEGYEDVRALCRLIQLFGAPIPEVLAQQARLDALWHSLWSPSPSTRRYLAIEGQSDDVSCQVVVETKHVEAVDTLVPAVCQKMAMFEQNAKHLVLRLDNILQDMACSNWRVEVWHSELAALEPIVDRLLNNQGTSTQLLETKWHTVKAYLAAMTADRTEHLVWQRWQALIDLVDEACRRAWGLVSDNDPDTRSLTLLDYEIRPLMAMKAAELGVGLFWLDVAGVFKRWETTLQDLGTALVYESALAQDRLACGTVCGYLDAMERNLRHRTVAMETRHKIYSAMVDSGLERLAAGEDNARLMARRDRLEQLYRTPRSRSRKISLPCHFSSTAAWVASSSRRQPNAYVADPRNDLDMEIKRIVNKVPYKVELEMMPGEAGRYRFGDKIVYCRILKSRLVMVRVGGGK
jgi:hypothetical protein